MMWLSPWVVEGGRAGEWPLIRVVSCNVILYREIRNCV